MPLKLGMADPSYPKDPNLLPGTHDENAADGPRSRSPGAWSQVRFSFTMWITCLMCTPKRPSLRTCV